MKDRIALVLALGLVLWGILTISGLIYRNKSLTEGGGEFFVAIGGVLAGGLISYLTLKNGK